MIIRLRQLLAVAGVMVAMAALLSSCGEKKTRYDTNLLENGSFEHLGKRGIPTGWTLVNFRGIVGQDEVRYGVDNTEAHDGNRSFKFEADPGTRRFYALSQEIKVPEGTTHVRLRGWMQIDQVNRKDGQWAQCNFLLTFYDGTHHRFQELRFADKRTRLKFGTHTWAEENRKFRIPRGTRYVTVSCILGMDGIAWFDNVSLEIPKPLDWQTAETTNYVFHWLPGHPFPEHAIENQQRMFNYVCSRLHVKSNIRIGYYLYPDTATIRRILSIKGYQYISWDDRELHTINTNDQHELIHFITDPYGKPLRAMAEGLVFYLHDDWGGYPIDKVAAYWLATKQLPSLQNMTDYNTFARINAGLTIPSMASFTGFLIKRWGPEKLLALFGKLNGANSWNGFSAGVEKVYGVPCTDLEDAWHAALRGVDLTDLPPLKPNLLKPKAP